MLLEIMLLKYQNIKKYCTSKFKHPPSYNISNTLSTFSSYWKMSLQEYNVQSPLE